MHTTTPADLSRGVAERSADIPADVLLRAYRIMYLSRKIDDKEIQLKNQSQIFFQISGAGHEAILTAAGLCLRPGYDWFFPYYRDRALCLALGVTPYEMFLQAVGAADDPASGGRQMPSHWGHRRHNIVSQGSPTGSQCLQAVGCAEAGLLYERLPGIDGRESHFKADEVTYVSLGDGTTSEGEFWESLNSACLGRLPVVYLVEDNGWAISVPVEVQTPGGSISDLLRSFPGLLIVKADGTDFADSHRAMQEAVAYARERRGPALVHASVVRPYSHSLSDDERLYKTPDEREAEGRRDPVRKLARALVAGGIATEKDLEALHAEVEREINEAARQALAAAKPARDTAALWVFSPDVDPASEAFATALAPDGKPDTMVAAINRTLKDEMARDPRIVVFGEDVADCSREASLDEVQGKGGVFKVTHGLQRLFGSDRGVQLAAGRGQHHRPRRRHGGARDQAGRRDPVLRLHLARDAATARRDGDDALPVGQQLVVPDGGARADRRVPARRRAVPQPVRRQHLRPLTRHPPRVPVERAGRGRPAADGHPLRRPGDVPRAQAPVPADLQQGRVPGPRLHGAVRAGRGAPRGHRRGGLHLGRAGAAIAAGRPAGRRRTASAWPCWTCGRSCPATGTRSASGSTRTNRVIVAHEDQLTCGFGAEIAARIAQDHFHHLDAPVRRVASLDTPVAYCPDLEEAILPNAANILDAIRETARY